MDGIIILQWYNKKLNIRLLFMKLLSLATYFLVSFGIAALAILAFFAFQTHSPQQEKSITIGVIQYLSLLNPVIDGFQESMEELGYTQGKNIAYQVQSAEGDREKLKEIANYYISQDVDMIYAVTAVAATVALQETQKRGKENIPIVYAYADNPVEVGLARDLRRPQTNATGIAVDLKELTAKKLSFLQEINPAMERLGVFTAEHSDPAADLVLAELYRQAPRFNLEIVEYTLLHPPGLASTQELDQLAHNIQQGEIHALFQIPGPVVNQSENVELLINLSKRLRIPSVFTSLSHVQQGGLFAYSHDFYAVGAQSAQVAHKILQGAMPQDIPIDLARDNILAINFQTVREIGVLIPESMLTLVTAEFGDR